MCLSSGKAALASRTRKNISQFRVTSRSFFCFFDPALLVFDKHKQRHAFHSCIYVCAGGNWSRCDSEPRDALLYLSDSQPFMPSGVFTPPKHRLHGDTHCGCRATLKVCSCMPPPPPPPPPWQPLNFDKSADKGFPPLRPPVTTATFLQTEDLPGTPAGFPAVFLPWLP